MHSMRFSVKVHVCAWDNGGKQTGSRSKTEIDLMRMSTAYQRFKIWEIETWTVQGPLSLANVTNHCYALTVSHNFSPEQ